MSRDETRKTLSGILHASTDILRGEAISMPLPEHVDVRDIEHMLDVARPRFGPHGMWTISATRVESLTPAALAHLREAFKAFRIAGGETLLVWSVNPASTQAFVSAAKTAGLAINIVKTNEELNRIAKTLREDRERRLRERSGP